MEIIRAHGRAMAIDLNRELDIDSSDADRLVEAQAALRSLPVALVVRDDGEVVVDSSSYWVVSSEQVQRYLTQLEGKDDQVVFVRSEDDAVLSVTKLDMRGADYLIVGRYIDERAVRDGKERRTILLQ